MRSAFVTLLLRLYPREFRERFGPGMRYALAEDEQHARSRGLVAHLAFWIVTTIDAVRFGLRSLFTRRRRPIQHLEAKTSMRALLTTDWRDAWRSLRSTPIVTAIAVLSLALGIGANTALFSILNTLIFKPLPVRDPQQLVAFDSDSWTNPIWEALRERHTAFADAALAWAGTRFDFTAGAASEPVRGLYVSGGFFDVLGVGAERGRPILPHDDPGGRGSADAAVAMLSHGFWQRRFGGREDVIGRAVTLNRAPFTIVGIAPAGFVGLEAGANFDVAVPIAAERLIRGDESALDRRHDWWLNLMFRLRPGQSLEDANAKVRALQPHIRLATLPADWRPSDQEGYLRSPFTFVAAGAGRSELRARYERPLAAILMVAGLVLLIACANIANLLLARAVARRHELSVRLALGASRFRLSRQLLAESVLLTSAGTILGVAFAHWGGQALVSQLATGGTSVTLDLSLDWRVIAFTAGVGGTTALLFGLAPAVGLSSLSPNSALREQDRGVAGDRRLGLRNVLVIAQVALSLAIVVAAGLFVRTLTALTTRDAGFDRRSVLVAQVDLQSSAVAAEDRTAVFERLRQAVAAVPGAVDAAASFTTPVSRRGWNTAITLPGSTLEPRRRLSWVNAVSPRWFSTFGVRLIAGRDFDARDAAGGPRVAIVNRAFAARYVKGENPVGATFTADGDRSYEIVAVVEDTVYRSLRSEMSPAMFIPIAQWDQAPAEVTLAVRSREQDPLALVNAITFAVREHEPQASLAFHSLEEQVRSSLTQERLVAKLSTFFGVLALVLAGLGLYGVTSYAVSRRRAEIGIRMALGADPAGVIRLVLSRMAWLVGLGMIAGAGLSLWAGRFICSLLYGLEPRDPITFVAAMLVLSGVSFVAGWLPARRASRIDPTVVLRES